MTKPSNPVGDGRAPGGRFGQGNRFGKGNPHSKQAQRLRSTLYNAVTDEDLREVIHALIREAKSGSIPAIKELLNRLLGPPEVIDLLARLEAMEEQFRVIGKQGAA